MSTLKLFYAFGISLGMFCMADSFSETSEERTSVFLSEVMFFPKDNEPQWVEITNYGREKINIADWCITDYDGNIYRFPKDFPLLPSGASVAVVFWESDKPMPVNTSVFNNSDPFIVYQHWNQRHQKTVFDAESDQCGLYSSAELSEKTIQDFVCWGLHPNIDSLDPVKAGIWAEDKYLRIRTDPKSIPVGESALGRGMSIARLSYTNNRVSDWIPCGRMDVSLGGNNPYPRPYFYAGGHNFFVDYFRKADWHCTVPCHIYHFQMSEDSEFTKIIIDTKTNKHEYQFLNENFKKGKYFWRIKGIHSNKQETAWSVTHVVLTKVENPDL